jgi:hypothetical protein
MSNKLIKTSLIVRLFPLATCYFIGQQLAGGRGDRASTGKGVNKV